MMQKNEPQPIQTRTPKRRLARSLFLLLVLLFCGIGLWLFAEAFLIGPTDLTLVRKNLPVPNLPEEWNGLKIVLMSDFHASKNRQDQKLIRRAIELANRQNADLILLLGDFLKGHKESQAMPMNSFFPLLRELKAGYGVYAVFGNHDRWIGTAKLRQHLKEAGIQVLENGSVTFERKGKRLHLAGLTEMWPQTHLRFVKRQPEEPLIVMMHEPRNYLKITARTTLLVAGHTHGGQVKLPLFGRPGISVRQGGERFAYGLIEETPGKKMFVTSGLGTSLLRVRFHCPPEVVVLTLEKE